MNIPIAPKAFAFASSSSSIPGTKNGCLESKTPTNNYKTKNETNPLISKSKLAKVRNDDDSKLNHSHIHYEMQFYPYHHQIKLLTVNRIPVKEYTAQQRDPEPRSLHILSWLYFRVHTKYAPIAKWS